MEKSNVSKRKSSAKKKIRLLDLSKLSSEQLSALLEKGYQDISAGRTKPAKEVFESIMDDYSRIKESEIQ